MSNNNNNQLRAFKTILRKIIFNVKSCLLNFTKNIRIT